VSKGHISTLYLFHANRTLGKIELDGITTGPPGRMAMEKKQGGAGNGAAEKAKSMAQYFGEIII
jgi:hypothetical protein